QRTAARTVRRPRQRPFARRLERRSSLTSKFSRRGTVELHQQRQGPVEMVRADLDELFDSPTVQPGGKCRMEPGSRRFRETRVGDLANEDVLEAQSLLAADRGMRLGQDEGPPDQRRGRLVHALLVA